MFNIRMDGNDFESRPRRWRRMVDASRSFYRQNWMCVVYSVRTWLAATNLAYMICGLLFICGSSVYYYRESQPQDDEELLLSDALVASGPLGPLIAYRHLALCFLIVCIYVTAAGFLGCWGAWGESPCFLCLHIILVFTMVLLEIVFAILLTAMQEKIFAAVHTIMYQQIQFEYLNVESIRPSNESVIFQVAPHNRRITTAWDNIQRTLGCCGVAGPEDFEKSLWLNQTIILRHDQQTSVPNSCCYGNQRGENAEDDDAGSTDSSDYFSPMQLFQCQNEARRFIASKRHYNAKILHTKGCRYMLFVWMRSHMAFLTVIASLVVSAQTLDFMLSCLLMRWKRKADEMF